MLPVEVDAAAVASGRACRYRTAFRSLLARIAFACAALLGAADIASATPPPVPELLHYTFDETGAAVTNHASAPPAGTATGDLLGSSFVQGIPYNGFVHALRGTGALDLTDYLDTHWAPNVTGAWTISFFTSDVPASTTIYYVFGEANSGSLRCFTNGVAGTNNWMLRGTTTDVLVVGGATVAPHLITVVYDPVSADIKAYLDAVLVTVVPQGAVQFVGDGLKIGAYGSLLPQIGLNGKMADFRVYSHALTSSEISDIYTWATMEMPMTLEVVVDNDVSCNGGADGGATAVATGGIGPYSYLWSNGATTASASDLAAGPNFVTVTDDFGEGATGFAIIVEPPAIVFGTTTLPGGVQGLAYSTSIGASGGTGTLTYAVATGALPAGLTLAGDGTLSGTPGESGTFDFTVSAADANSCLVDQAFTLQVNPVLSANITSQNDITCAGGSNGALTVTPIGGLPPYTYSWSPSGGTSATASGLIAGTYTVTVTDASNAVSTATGTVSEPPPIVFNTDLAPAYLQMPYSTSIAATGGAGGFTYAVSQGALPPGLSLGGGLLSGTPTTTGAFTFEVEATDALACTARQSYTLDVSEYSDVIFDDGFDG
jgi:hypothetical protein